MPLQSVNPGDLITYSNWNALVTAVNALQDRVGSGAIPTAGDARITFSEKVTSARFDGSIVTRDGVSFVLNVQEGELLDIEFGPGLARMRLFGADGTVLWSGMGDGTTFTDHVPLTQDYYLAFDTPDIPLDFTLTVRVGEVS